MQESLDGSIKIDKNQTTINLLRYNTLFFSFLVAIIMTSSGSSMLAILRDSLKQGWNRVPQTKTVAPHRGVASSATTGTSMNTNSNPYTCSSEQEQHQNTSTENTTVGAKEQSGHKQPAYTTSSPSSSPSRLLWEEAHGFDSYDGFGPWLWFP